MSNPTPPVELVECSYLIFFELTRESQESGKKGYTPYVDFSEIKEEKATLPLGLDRSFIPCIPILWYTLHLPRNRYDLIKLPSARLKVLQNLNLPHRIILFPLPFPQDFLNEYHDPRPKIVFLPEGNKPNQDLFGKLGSVISVNFYNELGVPSLDRHWKELHKAFAIEEDQFIQPSRLIQDKIKKPAWLPANFLARQIWSGNDQNLPPDFSSNDEVIKYSMENQAIISAIFRTKNIDKKNYNVSTIPKKELQYDRAYYKSPVSLGIYGISSRATSREFEALLKKFKVRMCPEDYDIEKEILGFMVAHRALASNGIGFVGNDIEDEAFHILGILETHWALGNPKPRFVWRALYRIGQILDRCFSSTQKSTLNHASRITCFSEFPIGLGIFPGCKSPLAFQSPIAYRPLAPLSRSMPFELNSIPAISMKKELKILFAECIPKEDLVGRLSRESWKVIRKMLKDTLGVVTRFEEVFNVVNFKKLLDQDKFDILVISAHGGLDTSKNRTGFKCGDHIVVEHELGKVPPIVFLSSCQVAPRGKGSLNISDLFFRQGAIAVFGTLVPIDVMHNGILMTRFFANIAETLEGTEKRFRTLEDIWYFTLTSNAFTDILLGNRALREWAVEKKDGKPVTFEFQAERSVGRLRATHMYEDSLSVLEEIAIDRGVHEKFKSWTQGQGFLPESIFYAALGWPERIIFNDPMLEEMIDEKIADSPES